ncbi:MAG: hypothetical protein QOF35_84 [Actinomycetota bacterium]|nr:hypothetical protein [Actinomycetota bacterium]
MTRYVAFLRGINLGASNKIAMPKLRAMAERLGYADVRIYINSGNLLFTSSRTDLALTQDIHSAIKSEFGYTIDVAVRTEDQLRRILKENPYPDGDPSQVTVAFLTEKPPATAKDKVAAIATDQEPFTIAGTEVWVNYTQGLARSKLAAQFSKIIGVSATVRNVRTVGKIVAMLD